MRATTKVDVQVLVEIRMAPVLQALAWLFFVLNVR